MLRDYKCEWGVFARSRSRVPHSFECSKVLASSWNTDFEQISRRFRAALLSPFLRSMISKACPCPSRTCIHPITNQHQKTCGGFTKSDKMSRDQYPCPGKGTSQFRHLRVKVHSVQDFHKRDVLRQYQSRASECTIIFDAVSGTHFTRNQMNF